MFKGFYILVLHIIFRFLVTRAQYPIRFTVENRYDKKIYLQTTLPKPHDVIVFDPNQKIAVNVSVASNQPIEIKALDYFGGNTEPLSINGKFRTQLIPGSTDVIPLAVPSLDYGK